MDEGKLIALEGADGCGKSTQVEMLKKWLSSEGFDVKTTKEPTDGPVGKILRKNLNNEIDLCPESEALLFAGDRAQHVFEELEPELEEGKIIITGRYLFSSLVYQNVRGLELDWLEKINKHALKPDLTILIDVPTETGLKRVNETGSPDKFEENLDMQKKVRETYLEIAKENNIPVVDGAKSIENVHNQIKKEVKKALHTDLSGKG